MQEMRRVNYFFKIFYCNPHYYKRLVPKFSVMVSGNDCKYCNVMNHRKLFFQGFKIISTDYTKHASCITSGLL